MGYSSVGIFTGGTGSVEDDLGGCLVFLSFLFLFFFAEGGEGADELIGDIGEDGGAASGDAVLEDEDGGLKIGGGGLDGGRGGGGRLRCSSTDLLEAEIRAAFDNEVEAVRRNVMKDLVQAAWPRDFDGRSLGAISEAEIGAEVALRKIASAAGDFANLGDFSGGEADPGSQGVMIALGADELKIDEVIFVAAGIVEERGRITVVGDDDVDVAVVLEIGESGAAGRARRKTG